MYVMNIIMNVITQQKYNSEHNNGTKTAMHDAWKLP